MKLLQYHDYERGLILETENGKIKLEIITDDIIHVIYTQEEEFSSKNSLMVNDNYKQKLDWNYKEKADELMISTSKLQLNINKQSCSFTYLDRDGNLLVKEPEAGGKTLDSTEVEKVVFDEKTKLTTEASADGDKISAENIKTIIDREAYHTKLEFEWDENEALYGLGSHEEGIINYRGHHQYLYQQNMKAVVPVLVSTKGYGIMLDSYSLITFHDDMHGSYFWTEIDDELDYYFIYGPEFDEIVSSYRNLTGQVPMFPKWTFGYIQSKEAYISQEELIDIVKEHRERGIPLDCIVQDWQYWPEGCWGQKEFSGENYPEPGKMIDKIHDLNVKIMISIWPNFRGNEGSNFLEMKEKGYLLENQSTYDAFSREAREMYWKHAKKGLFAKGIDAWWCDCTEPIVSDWEGEVKPEPEQRMDINTSEAKKYLDPEYINAYSLKHSQGIYEGQRETTDDKRVVNLTRSAYAGQQRYGTITWSGDITATWDTFKKQIAEGLNFCATGLPYWTVDIGAFFVKNDPNYWFWSGDYDKGCEDLGYRELYTRWFQYGAFLPIFRSHGTDTPRELWRFGEKGSQFYDTLLKFNNLRYRLIPYIYSLAGKVTHQDYTIMRALPFDFREDDKTYDIKDQYLFGSAFLVNPVTKPMYYEAGSQKLKGVEKTRSVYLPENSDWYNFWTGEKFKGGQKIEARATLDIMPLFVKAGSIVPFGPKIEYTDQKPDHPIELRIYPGADGEFNLYDDEGDNYNYEEGAYELINIKWNNENKVLTFDSREGSYPGMKEKRKFKIVLVSTEKGTGIKEVKEPEKTVIYTGEKK
ncbi:MAG: TIM-barrel domain-containing protein, partial [Bacillota bacterium]